MRWTWSVGCLVLLMLGMLLVVVPPVAGRDWALLFAGDVVVEPVKHPDGIPGLRASFAVAAPRERIWAVLLDYTNFPKIFPDIHDLRVLTHDPQGDQVEYWVNAVVSKYHYVLYRHYDEPGRRLTWTRVAGDLKRMEGSWEIHDTPRSDVQMLVYESYIDIGGVVPKALVRMEAMRKAREPQLREVVPGAVPAAPSGPCRHSRRRGRCGCAIPDEEDFVGDVEIARS
jgi:ribosome-associated toxin RatA of RatAB toxin-antitoxin module